MVTNKLFGDNNYNYDSFKLSLTTYDQDRIYDICAKLHCPNIIIEKIVCKYEKLKTEYLNVAQAYLIAASIYSICNKENCSKSLNDICFVCNCSVKKFLKKTRYLPLTHIFDITSMTESILQELKLGFVATKTINEKVFLITQQTDFSPKTCIAVATYLYLKDNNFKISIPKLSKQLNVSSMSMYRCLKKIKNDTS